MGKGGRPKDFSLTSFLKFLWQCGYIQGQTIWITSMNYPMLQACKEKKERYYCFNIISPKKLFKKKTLRGSLTVPLDRNYWAAQSINEKQHSFYVKKRQNGGQNSKRALRVPLPLQWSRYLQGGDRSFPVII